MKCPNCGKENQSNAAFCKGCGGKMQDRFKTCKNGHNYDASLNSCPFCPSDDRTISGAETMMDSPQFDSAKTMMDTPMHDRDKTMMDLSKPRINSANITRTVADRDSTMIYTAPSKDEGAEGSDKEAKSGGALRKLVGWLVTFDVNPIGQDYKLYQGRQIIGSKSSCEICIQQPGISSEHAVLLYRNGKLILQDNLSTNGTFVNDEMIEDKVELNNDDIIKVALINLKVKII